MKNILIALMAFYCGTTWAQVQDVEKFALIETSEFIEEPKDVLAHIVNLKSKDSLELITFLKTNGELAEHGTITKKALTEILERTNFRNRYFVVLIDKTAIFYLD
ncbi:hypothetical protein FVB32_06035 [Flagellimonas hymeniacidonis]|uniref:Uncharacterized protein n=1 Tax=Flagellimonas hymeniacidonis TaxID=2603628 RepID=A0A5C8V832_9FLAO|nr:hypothetical protein [Flagellimonas hymeniacidonis]TXN37847.1 hypothetical protein FVB32_06035 [Flagellimonas hymeniacidonis]